jgi:hypothetical protein
MAYHEAASASIPFNYEDDSIDVFVFETENGEKDGFADGAVVSKLLAPLVGVRNWGQMMLLSNATPSMKLVRNGKHYVHALLICKYLAETTHNSLPEFHFLRRLVVDLLNGIQAEQPLNIVNLRDDTKDHLLDIKNQLCTVHESIISAQSVPPNIPESATFFTEMLNALNTINLAIDNMKTFEADYFGRLVKGMDAIFNKLDKK